MIDVYVLQRRDIASARAFFTAALTVDGEPGEVITDRAPALANVIEELLPAALHSQLVHPPGVHAPEETGVKRRQLDCGFTLTTVVRA